MTWKHVSLRMLTFACMALLSGSLGAAEVLDQQNDVTGSATADSTASGGQELAQTFTVGVDGTLSRIELQLSRPSFTTSGAVMLNVYNTSGGQPNESLGTASLPWDAVSPTGYGFQSFDVSSFEIPVQEGDVLAISIKAETLFFWRSTFNLDPYAGGESMYRVLNSPPGPWTSFSPSHDYGFQTYVDAMDPTVLSGDYNGDHTVDAADYTVWRNNLGAETEAALLGNGDGMNGVDVGDYTLWKSNYGESNGGGAALASARSVPEPNTLAFLILIGVLAQSIRHRRRAMYDNPHSAAHIPP
jgi:hypothetical protein